MRVKLGGLLTFLIASICNFSYAQLKPSAIRGNITLQNNTAAEAATVVLLHQPDSLVIASALVNNKGTFQFLNVRPGRYVLLATRLGAKRAYSQGFTLTAGQDIIIPTIILSSNNNELKEVTVVASRPFIETRPGKIIINPQASISADGKSALEILKQSPGVKIDNADNISVNGKQSALIMIDGKNTNLNVTDLAALLRGTQGTTVDRIEIIRNGSAKYDASAGGVINIVLKKGKNIGTNGTFTASAGYGKYYKTNAGIMFNSRTKNVNIFGNYNIDARKTYRDILTDRNVTNAGVVNNYNSHYHSISDILGHNFKAGADFSLNSNNTIGILVNGQVTGTDIAKTSNLKISNQGNLDSAIRATSTINRNINYLNYNINYSGTLDKAGKTLTASINYSPYNRHNNEYIDNQFTNAAGAPYRDNLLLQNLSPSNRKNFTTLVDYVAPFAKKGKLEAGLKYSKTKSDNNYIFGPLVNNQYSIDTTASSRFIYREQLAAGYLNYSNTFGKLDIETGLRGEYTHTKGTSQPGGTEVDRSYFNLFPTVLLNYRQNDKNQFALNLSRGITRPPFEYLNPFATFIDLYSLQTGNPLLKPSYTNNIAVDYTYNNKITTSLFANFNTDDVYVYYLQTTKNVIVLGRRNLGDVNTLGLRVNMPLQFFDWWTSNYNISAMYLHYKAYPENGSLNQGTQDILLMSTQTFKLNKAISAELFGSYESANLYGVNRFKPTYRVDAGLRAQVLKNKGTIGAGVSDIFNTLRDRYTTNYQGIDLRQTDKTESRIFRLNFTYRFGKSTVRGARTRNAGNEDEQNRMRRN